jgi:hypothetical protein
MTGDTTLKTITATITAHIASEVHGTGADIITHGTGTHGLSPHGDTMDGMTLSIFPDGTTHGITDGLITTIIIADGTGVGILIGDIITGQGIILEMTGRSMDATDGMV